MIISTDVDRLHPICGGCIPIWAAAHSGAAPQVAGCGEGETYFCVEEEGPDIFRKDLQVSCGGTTTSYSKASPVSVRDTEFTLRSQMSNTCCGIIMSLNNPHQVKLVWLSLPSQSLPSLPHTHTPPSPVLHGIYWLLPHSHTLIYYRKRVQWTNIFCRVGI